MSGYKGMKLRRAFKDPSDLFWSKVDVRGPDECWPWKCGADKDGYGKFQVTNRSGVGPKQKHWRAHRFALSLKLGREPGEVVMHSCDYPPCCNPDHISEGSTLENVADRDAKGRTARGARWHEVRA